MRYLLPFLIFALTACASIDQYSATVSSPGGEYEIQTKRGSLIEVHEPDGTVITADDRGHPKRASILESLLGLAVLKSAETN